MVRSSQFVFSKFTSLLESPFENNGNLHSHYQSLFQSKGAFRDNSWTLKLENLSRTTVNGEEWGKPFAKGLGVFFMNYNQFRRVPENRKQSLPLFLGAKNDSELSVLLSELYGYHKSPVPLSFFRYDSKRQDQRMNSLFWELKYPLKISCKYADITIFLHLYPTGLLTTIINVSNVQAETKEELAQIYAQIAPWNSSSQVQFHGKKLKGRFTEILTFIEQQVKASILINSDQQVTHSKWYSAIKVSGLIEKEFASQTFLNSMSENTTILSDLRIGPFPESTLKGESNLAVFSKKGFVICASLDAERRKTNNLFWDFCDLAEFVQMRVLIQDEYQKLLRKQLTNLSVSRQKFSRKLVQEKWTALSIYQPEIREHLAYLDQEIKSINSAFHRKVYAVLSEASDLNASRQTFKKLILDYEEEVEKWTSVPVAFLETVISPILSIFKLLFSKN